MCCDHDPSRQDTLTNGSRIIDRKQAPPNVVFCCEECDAPMVRQVVVCRFRDGGRSRAM